ncbi:MAG: alkaline phosphatase [Planctomycetia bacterium]|nr:alkaline phosphatase [Planctomycetia bacterium]
MGNQLISGRTPAAVATICALLAAWSVARSAQAQVAGAEHVVIVGCDGMSPEGIRQADTPHMDRMMREGAFSLHARAVMPTSSSPNWASMIMGAGPEQHGVTSNGWERDKFQIVPTATGPEGIFPTIFGVLRAGRPRAVIACFHDWDGFGRLVEGKSCDALENADGPLDATRRAVGYFAAKKPHFTFVHLDHVDHAGHTYGWGSEEYIQAVAEADRYIGDIFHGLRAAGMHERAIVLVTSDHGGREKGHGGATMEEIEIPWIITGQGVASGKELQTPVNTYDTAATVAYIFGLSPPERWIARPVREAFRDAR